jgi:hypothetical protein
LQRKRASWKTKEEMRRQTVEGCHQTAQYEKWANTWEWPEEEERIRLWPVNRLNSHCNKNFHNTFFFKMECPMTKSIFYYIKEKTMHLKSLSNNFVCSQYCSSCGHMNFVR